MIVAPSDGGKKKKKNKSVAVCATVETDRVSNGGPSYSLFVNNFALLSLHDK